MASCRCQFCERAFVSAQAVRAHLKSCEPYQKIRCKRTARLDESAYLGSGSLGVPSLGSGSVSSAALGNVANDGPIRKHGHTLHHEVGHERQERQHRDHVRDEDRTLRFEKIQSVLRAVIDSWWPNSPHVEELKSHALRAILREFQPLPVEYLHETELVIIATGIRDSIFRKAKQENEFAEKRSADRQLLIDHGRRYAQSELRSVDELTFDERLNIEKLVNSELDTVEGNESLADIEDLVESILEDQGIGRGDDDE